MKLSKTYDPKKYETAIYKLWEDSDSFVPKNRGNDGTFSIVVPPPNANGDLHMGHGLTLGIEDIAVRYHRMKGEASLLLPGADHAGFETWVVYEKHLVKQGKSRFDFSREDLYSQIWDFVAQNKDNYQSQFRQLGASVDWSRFTYTLDNKIVKQAYSSFKKMWDDGLIYRANKLVNFCTYHGTGFADIEVTHKDSDGHLWYIDYPLTDGSGEITVATTRPETMLGDTAVAVNPKDKRYKTMVGKTVKLPLTDREIPIIADDYVDSDYGTGAVKITPAHDPNDFEIGERHDLPKISVIGHDGLITHEAPEEFVGLDVIKAREAVVSTLTKQQLLSKTENINHSVAHCYKCGTVIQPLLREQWFIDTKPLAKKAISALKAKQIRFYPDNKRTQLIAYYEGLRDWNISRQIAWGIPIPAFRNANDPDKWIFDDRVKQETITVDGELYHRDPDVFDTWFSSSSWPYATMNFPDGQDFAKFYPLSAMETGADILYPWVSRMIMFGLYNTGRIPFENVYLHGLIQDEHGQKMSKSKGNVINPIDKVNQFGSDAFRMGIISGESAGNNRPYDESKVIGARNFCNKLWNIARFIQDQIDGAGEINSPKPKSIADHWMLTKLQHLTVRSSSLLEDYRFSEAYDSIYHFVWDDFADWFIEASKTSANIGLLKFGLESILKLCHPFAPFLTEAIWKELGWSKELLITSAWPTIPEADNSQAKKFEEIKQLITEVRQLSKAMELKRPNLLHSSDLVEDENQLITRMARIGEIRKTDKGRGYRLKSTKQKVWLDISDDILATYTKQLKENLKEVQRQIANYESRLSNKGYLAKAPDKVVNDTKSSLAEAETKAKLLSEEVKRFSSS
ncbi:valine--tRNA ligase [Candidatus Saccharibacteria bacterium]|nr:valine--tRNA ligase [Candidatus Saccharibacteria bacterium]